MWGNNIRAVIAPASKAKTQILEIVQNASGKKYVVKNGGGFNPGDVVSFSDGEKLVYNRVVKNQDYILEFEKEFEEDVVDKNLVPKKVIST